MLQTMQASMVDAHGDGGQHTGMPNLNTFITQMLGGVSGDAVYSEEALDRIITQMMDQNHQGSAPGPASAAAIAALPKKPADKTMMGSDGKAECSVCMDAVDIGDEVTILPCNHWFHGDCVGAWLKEHDTCPHCRAGIMVRTIRSHAFLFGNEIELQANGVRISNADSQICVAKGRQSRRPTISRPSAATFPESNP